MTRRPGAVLFSALFTAFFIYTLAFGDYVIVREKGTLSHLVQEKMDSPIYGRNNHLEQVIQLNPQIKDPNVIYPGQKILFPEGVTQDTQPTDSTPNLESAPQPLEGPPQEKQTLLNPSWIEFRLIGTQRKNDSLLKSNSGKASLESQFDTGASLEWRQSWSEQWASVVLGEIAQETYVAPDGITLDGGRANFFRLEAGPAYRLSSALEGRLLFKSDEQLFFRASSPTSIQMDSVRSLGVKAQLWWRLFLAQNWSTEVKPSAELVFGRSAKGFQFSSGTRLLFDVQSLYEIFLKNQLILGGTFGTMNQPESSYDFKNTTYQVFMGWRVTLE